MKYSDQRYEAIEVTVFGRFYRVEYRPTGSRICVRSVKGLWRNVSKSSSGQNAAYILRRANEKRRRLASERQL